MTRLEQQLRHLSERGHLADPHDVVARALASADGGDLFEDAGRDRAGGYVRPVLVGIGSLAVIAGGVAAVVAIRQPTSPVDGSPASSVAGPPSRNSRIPCGHDKMIEFANTPPRSLVEMAAQADVLAEVEVTRRYELPQDESIDEITTRRMAHPSRGLR